MIVDITGVTLIPEMAGRIVPEMVYSESAAVMNVII